GGRPAHLDLVFFLRIGGGRQADAGEVEVRALEQLARGKARRAVRLGPERALHVAGADAQLEHHRRAGGLRELEAVLHHLDDLRQARARVDQPDLRLHGEGVAALLDDGGALAVVLAEHDERAALHARGGEVGERIGSDVGAHRGLEGHRAAQGVIDGRAEHRRRAPFRGVRLDMHAELVQDVARVVQHVHHVRHRRALVAADVRHARLQQRLGDRENAFAVERLAVAEPEFRDLFPEGALHADQIYQMRVAVLGGGTGAHAAAADLSGQGHEVRHWRRDAGALRERINLEDAMGMREMRIAGTCADIGEAVRGAELVFMPDPAFTQPDNALRLAPHLADGQVVFLAPGTFGAYVMTRAMRAAGNGARLAIAETGTLPRLTRLHC